MTDQPTPELPVSALTPAPLPLGVGRRFGSVLLGVVFVGIVLTLVLLPSSLRAQVEPATAPRTGYGFSFALPTVPVQSHVSFGGTVAPRAPGSKHGGSITGWVLLVVGTAVVLAGGGTLLVRARRSRLQA